MTARTISTTVVALDLKARPDDAGVAECACHDGNHRMRYMLAASRRAGR